jgi:hypothetical protein
MREKRRRTELSTCYANRRTSLKLVADFSAHWKALEKTYGYVSARIKVPYKEGADFWVHLHLIAQPATFDVAASLPPRILFEKHDGQFYFQIRDCTLTVIVPLNQHALWGTVQGKTTPLLYVDRSLCRWKDDISLDLRVWITSESDRIPVPPQYEQGDGITVSGGQFESNRRKH